MTIHTEAKSRAWNITFATLLLTGLLALGGCSSVDALLIYYSNDRTDARWEATADEIRIPFTGGDHVTIPVRVNDSDTLNFVLDTGAPIIGLLGTDIAASIGATTGASVSVGGSGYGQSPTGSLVESLTVSVGETHLLDQTAVVVPWDELSFIDVDEDWDYQGIIGYDLLKRYVVRLDFDQSVLTLHKPDSYTYAGDGEVLPLEMHQRKPYTSAAVTLPGGADVNVKLHVDLGNRGELSLITGSLPEIIIPSDAVRDDGFGLSGRVEGYGGTVDELRLGSHTLPSVGTKFQTRGYASAGGRQGVLGLRVLERFNVVFDYPRNRMILEKRDRHLIP